MDKLRWTTFKTQAGMQQPRFQSLCLTSLIIMFAPLLPPSLIRFDYINTLHVQTSCYKTQDHHFQHKDLSMICAMNTEEDLSNFCISLQLLQW